MQSPEFAIISFDVRVLILSVLCSTLVSFFVATLLALRLWRQQIGLGSTALYALAGTAAFIVVAGMISSVAPTQAGSVGILLGLLATQWLLAKRLLPRLQRRYTGNPPATALAAWRVALVTVPASAIMLAIAGFTQMAIFFSPV